MTTIRIIGHLPHLVLDLTQQLLLLLALGAIHLDDELVLEVLRVVEVRVDAEVLLGHVPVLPVDELRLGVVGDGGLGLEFRVEDFGQRLLGAVVLILVGIHVDVQRVGDLLILLLQLLLCHLPPIHMAQQAVRVGVAVVVGQIRGHDHRLGVRHRESLAAIALGCNNSIQFTLINQLINKCITEFYLKEIEICISKA